MLHRSKQSSIHWRISENKRRSSPLQVSAGSLIPDCQTAYCAAASSLERRRVDTCIQRTKRAGLIFPACLKIQQLTAQLATRSGGLCLTVLPDILSDIFMYKMAHFLQRMDQ